METNYRKSATSYGITLGVVSALLTILIYVLDITLFTKWWVGIISFLIILIFGILSAKKTKQLVEGYTTFKQAFTGYFITVLIGSLIGLVVSFLLFNVIDPEAATIVKEETIEVTESMMQNFGAPQSEIDKAIVKLEEQDTFGLTTQLKNYAFGLVFYAVIGLIVALIFREKDPAKA